MTQLLVKEDLAMRACILVAVALLLAATSSGCNGINLARRGGCSGCQQCGPARGGHMMGHGGANGGGLLGHGMAGHHQSRAYEGPQGPATGQVAYPYYTTRGPRDFLINNPPSIGPY
ncbi:hypothetical protein Psta_1611 [Pirellula staleyi DSM 6068]|uniref:Uncharacterized protein n=1 Tax=Pirellula staleyi (strain ATCC 27377 / DSM 6068 / ICPB 4128) TaxID=530564 RepID=D2QY72_PIRSD|nr:hypothetical protein [Pirellula staleyi]ADB16286.1 hypothetical protein Psta_1611 [Pirellula staleyi DSM 6068]